MLLVITYFYIVITYYYIEVSSYKNYLVFEIQLSINPSEKGSAIGHNFFQFGFALARTPGHRTVTPDLNFSWLKRRNC